MIWLTWRQLRSPLLTVAVLLGAAAVYFLATGVHIHDTYSADLRTCGGDCKRILDDFSSPYQNTQALLQLVVLAVPVLIGIFWGAPLIAAEFERGTHRLTWNQSITPTRWLAVKLAGVGLAAVAVTGILGGLFSWWVGPLDAITTSRFGWNTFTTRGITPLGYALFAFALGAALGLFTRHVLMAMALTVAVFVGVQALIATQVRPHIMPVHTATVAIDSQFLSHPVDTSITGGPGGTTITFRVSGPPGSWKLSQTAVLDGSGAPLSDTAIQNCVEAFAGPVGPVRQAGPDQTQSDVVNCFAPYHPRVGVRYLPASDFWPLQWYETGIYAALSGALAGFCFWRIRRHRD